MAMDLFQREELKLRRRSTAWLIREYKMMNEWGRRIAREEFKRRKIGVKQLPFKRRTTQRKPEFSFGRFS